MKLITAIRTFVAGTIVPGWGYWIVGKRKLGFFAATVLIALVLIFCWSRLILDPVGYYVLLFCVLSILIGTALHSALIEIRSDHIPRDWKYALLYAAACFLLLFLLFSNRGATLGYEIFRLPSGSMAPTLLRGDYMIVDTWRYRKADPANGDIVVVKLPESGINYVKRVVGIPGDSVSLLSNQLARNSQSVDESYAMYDGPARAYHALPEQTVPPGHYLVLGDNRNNSRDSRRFGTIPKDNVVGRISHIFYSFDDEVGIRWERIPTQFD